MASEDSNTRMDSILHVDTPALLKTLKELEAQLSQYQRQDLVPKWAEAIMPRLDLVERGVKSIMVPQRAEHTEAFSLKDLEQEEIFSDKIKKIVDNRTESMKLVLDAKISSSSLEVDRLHKLLYIRPTTSELQQVMMHVREVESKVQKVHGDISGSIQGIVQEHLTKEMESLSERLRSTEEHSDKAVQLVLNKVDDLEVDIRRVREGAKGEVGEIFDGLQAMREQEVSMRNVISTMEENLKSVDSRCQGALEGLGRQLEEMAASNTDAEATANERMDGIDDTIAGLDENIKDEVVKNDDRYDELKYGLASMGEKLDEMKNSVLEQIEGLRANQENLSITLEKMTEKQSVIQEFINKLEKFQPIVKISDNIEAIQHLQEANHSNVQTSNIIKQDIKEILADQTKMQEELEDVPNRIQVESSKIDSANKEIAQLKDGHKFTKTELSKHTSQLDDLSVLKVDMIMVKGVSEAQDDRIKKMIRQVVEAGENLENQERRLDGVCLQQEVKDENITASIEAIKSDFDQRMENQSAEIEAKLEVLKETVVSGGGQTGVQGVSKPGARGAKAKSLKSSSIVGGKISDESSAKRIIEMIEDEEAQKQETPEDMVLNETADKIEYLMQLSLNFEEIASFRNSVPRDVPNAICYDIAACAQSIAAIVADMADLQAIQRMVRGAPQDIMYEDAVTQKRTSCLEQIMVDLKSKLREHHPDAGLLRLEARDMFLSRTYHALQLAISKYDQVLTTGHTRLGRISVPSCIACDRPLLTKAPRGNDNQSSANTTGGFSGGSSQYTNKAPLMPIGHVHNPNQSFFEPTRSSTFGTQVGSLDEELDALAQSSFAASSHNNSVRVPAGRAEGREAPEHEGDGGKTKGKEYAQYVKRGGFKMPPKLPQLSQSASGPLY